MSERLDHSILLGAILLAISGCASNSDATRSQLTLVPLAGPDTAAIAEDPPDEEAVVVLPYSEKWSNLVEYMTPEPKPVESGFVCDLIIPSSPTPGPWQLAGISSVYYTPILDIYSDRQKLGAKNEMVYYHFRLSNDAR